MYRYTVKRNEQLTPSVMLLTLAYDPGETKSFGYRPGQYAAIAFGHGRHVGHARCFSIASSPNNPDELQFGVRIGGKFTHGLQHIKPGDRVDVRGPFGGFIIDPQHHKELVLIAGGIGITPFMSMLRHIHSTPYPYNIKLLYGVQDQHDIPFYEEIKQIAADVPNLSVTLAVSHGDVDALKGQHVVQGRVDGALLHEALENRPAEKTVFICGPPPMMNSLVEAAAIRGVPNEQIVTEAFKQGQHRQTGKITSWPRNMYVLGGVGIVIGGFVITALDIVKNLPTKHLTNDANAQRALQSKSSRAADLDTLVNSFAPDANTGKTASPAAAKAIEDAKQAAASSTSTSGSSSSSTSPTTTTTPTPKPAPAPAPAPVCTTSQSGVTTCV